MTTFREYARENTGKLLTDSGDAFGRHWQKAPIKAGLPLLTCWTAKYPPLIETTTLLDLLYTIDRNLVRSWRRWDKLNGQELSMFVSAREFMKLRKYVSTGVANTYNSDSDLNQDFTWEVWQPERKADEDWLYSAMSTVVVVHLHNGCDAREGYTTPIFCRCSGSMAVPTHLTIEYRSEDGVYTWPSYFRLKEDVETWHEDTRGCYSIEVTLKDGKRMRVIAEEPPL